MRTTTTATLIGTSCLSENSLAIDNALVRLQRRHPSPYPNYTCAKVFTAQNMFGSAPARKLAVALASREDRNIRRRLHDPSLSLVDSRCHFRRHRSGYHYQSHTATASASDLLQQLPLPFSLRRHPPRVQSRSRSARSAPHADLPLPRGAPLQLRLRRQRGLQRVRAAVNTLLYDGANHALLHHGARVATRMPCPLTHNDACALRAALRAIPRHPGTIRTVCSSPWRAYITWLAPSLLRVVLDAMTTSPCGQHISGL